MERLTTYICGYAHGAEGVREDSLTGNYCRGEFEATAIVDRLAAYEDTGLEPKEIELLAKQRDLYVDACGELPLKRIRELDQADKAGQCFIGPFVAMIEQSLSGGEMKPQRDQRFNGRYAVVYFDPKKWSSPLIDICGTPYNREEAEERMKVLKAALRREQE